MAPAVGSDLRGRFRGCLYGVALGDALGAPYEGRLSVPPERVAALDRDLGRLRYTDDTHMTIGTAESLIARADFDGAHMARRLAANLAAEPWRGYGPGPPKVFRRLGQGVPWDEAGATLFGGAGSYGNGAAMRIAPVAMFACSDLDEVVELTRLAASITHTHELGVDGAVMQAVAVAWLLVNPSEGAFDPGPLLDELRRRVRSPVFQERIDQVAALSVEGERADIVGVLGHGIEAARSVPTALVAFLRNHWWFAETVRFAVALGGDTDTIASMAGALSGAHLGEEAIPEAWRQGVENAARLRELADSLLELATSPRV
jgi:poly(ADP-ribose) glycohydrolase ARH3